MSQSPEAMKVWDAAGLNAPVFSFESGLVDIRPAWAAMLTAFTRDHYLSALAEEDGKEL